MARNVIVIRRSSDPREEGGIVSVGAIRPGMLVEPTSTGHYKAHDSAGAIAAPIFAREQHENDGHGVDDLIALGDNITVVFAQLGDVINCVTADTIAKDGFVESAGDGTVRAYGSGYRIGYARAASDLSGTVGRVEVVIAPVGV